MLVASFAVPLVACTAVSVNTEAMRVEFTAQTPANCESLGEIVGTQGNWFTSAWTHDADLILGARNQLRNKANALGANLVVIEDKNHSGRGISSGVHNSSVVGHAYLCLGRPPTIIRR